ncbi:MAG: hypothetical protein OXF08_06655 [Bacteroidetes bacterium]|nr:hypothetical protein [Bacteroidota bacterium]
MDPLHFIRTAKKLARGRGGKPQQVDLRRAVSTNYYGLFHCVANAYADSLIGTWSKQEIMLHGSLRTVQSFIPEQPRL